MEQYFVISASDDGGADVEIMTKEEVLEAITPDEDDYVRFKKVLKSMPNDWNYVDEDSCFIIKGDIIVPKEKKVVTEYEL